MMALLISDVLWNTHGQHGNGSLWYDFYDVLSLSHSLTAGLKV